MFVLYYTAMYICVLILKHKQSQNNMDAKQIVKTIIDLGAHLRGANSTKFADSLRGKTGDRFHILGIDSLQSKDYGVDGVPLQQLISRGFDKLEQRPMIIDIDTAHFLFREVGKHIEYMEKCISERDELINIMKSELFALHQQGRKSELISKIAKQ